MKLDAVRYNTLDIDAYLDWGDLYALIVKTVRDDRTLSPELTEIWDKAERRSIDIKVEINQLSEGSPSYSVNKWEARVKVSIDIPVSEQV